MRGLLITLCCLVAQVPSQETIMSLLMYEDQKGMAYDWADFWTYFNFLTLKRKIHEDVKKFKDITVCFRFNLLSYRGEARSSNLIAGYSKNHVEFLRGLDKTINSEYFQFYLNPVAPGNGAFIMNTYPELLDMVIPEDGVHWMWPIYNEDVDANKWHSMCFGLSIEKKISFLVHNGKTQENYTQPQIWADVSRGFDTTMVEPFSSIHPFDRNDKEDTWKKWSESRVFGQQLFENNAPFSGYFTDYQIFGRALSAQEMYDITSCKSFAKGDIYSWDVDDWEAWDMELQDGPGAVQYRTLNISRDSLCKTVQKYTFFPDSYTFEEGINLCRRFGGKIVDSSTLEKNKAIGDFLGKEIKLNEKYDEDIQTSTYTMYTDKREFNVWRHFETEELPIDPLVFNGGEPNGGMVENCAQLMIQPSLEDKTKFSAIFNDLTCKTPLSIACEGVGDILIKFRGICRYSLIDTTYTMVEGDMNKKRFFAGNTGWKIYWEEDGEVWKLGSPKKEFMYGIHTEFKTYPLGKNYWNIVNDTRCIYPNPEKVLINMSPCNTSSFTCDDGTCIHMSGR